MMTLEYFAQSFPAAMQKMWEALPYAGEPLQVGRWGRI